MSFGAGEEAQQQRRDLLDWEDYEPVEPGDSPEIKPISS